MQSVLAECCEVRCLLDFELRWEMLASGARGQRCDWLRRAVKGALEVSAGQRIANADLPSPSRKNHRFG